MKRFLLLVLILGLLCGCSNQSFAVNEIIAVPYSLDSSSGRMGLALYLDTTLDETQDPLQLTLSSPDGVYVWSFTASTAVIENTVWAGSSDICMPDGIDLPQGEWELKIAVPDGRVFVRGLSVRYDTRLDSDPEEFTGNGYKVYYYRPENYAIIRESGD
ncbi:MAG: hypothetical protein J5785_06490 [Spirochaetales bacterium]|nr:hypothetical protein [Spirochaetales bacterium]